MQIDSACWVVFDSITAIATAFATHYYHGTFEDTAQGWSQVQEERKTELKEGDIYPNVAAAFYKEQKGLGERPTDH